MSLRLFFSSLRAFDQSCNKKCNNNIYLLKLLFIFSLTLKLSLMRYHQQNCISTAIFSSSKTAACQAEPSRAEIISAHLAAAGRPK